MESLYHTLSSYLNCYPRFARSRKVYSVNSYSLSSSSVCGILELPDEILAEIIEYLDARERLILAESCTRFKNIVFENEALLRDLDFSKKGHLTTLGNIQRYFSKENVRKLVRQVNIENVRCFKAGCMLNNSIGRAINLVDVNIHGIEFERAEQLAIFLKPLVHLKRLSFDWPTSEEIQHANNCCKLLENPFNRLKYLSIGVRREGGIILSVVQLCQELEELRMVTTFAFYSSIKDWNLAPNKLKNLKIVRFRGIDDTWVVKNYLIHITPDPHNWTDFYIVDPHCQGYLERNVEVCEELRQVISKVLDERLMRKSHLEEFNYGLLYEASYNGEEISNVISQYLLKEVIALTHEDTPEEFSCLRFCGEPCLLKVEEAKRLLKDPGYQISYLNLIHDIQPVDDAHLVVSAFPNLTELSIGCISSRNVTTLNHTMASKRRLRKRGSTAPEELDDPSNIDCSFKMLVENTPHLKSLIILPQPTFSKIDRWDLDALYLIPGWKNLRAISLSGIPIDDGSFLIEIGKGCPELEEVSLWSLGSERKFYYGKELCEMLRHCKNLKNFSISQYLIDNMSEVFIVLSNNPKLEGVRMLTDAHQHYSLELLVSSIEQLLHQCPKLIKIQFAIEMSRYRIEKKLNRALKRIVRKLNRPNFVFDGPVLCQLLPHRRNNDVDELAPCYSADRLREYQCLLTADDDYSYFQFLTDQIQQFEETISKK